VPTYLGSGNKIDADASIRKGDFYSICLMPGYAHTFVIKEKFFITLSAFFGANFQQQQYYVGKEINDINKFIIAPKASGRVGVLDITENASIRGLRPLVITTPYLWEKMKNSII
jgi:hypothetical protein